MNSIINPHLDRYPDSKYKNFQTDIPIFSIFTEGLKLAQCDFITLKSELEMPLPTFLSDQQCVHAIIPLE